jgi:small subunit ribosomal protein S1
VFVESHPPGSVVEGEVKNKTEFGLFLGLDGDVDGMVHLSDLDWKRPGEQVIEEYKKGDMVTAQVLDVDVEKERISLGIKQLAGDPADEMAKYKKGDAVTCTVTSVSEAGIEVKIADSDLTSFVKRGDLSRDRSEQRPERFNVGDKVDVSVISVDKAARRIAVSIKALELAEEKQAVAQYGSSDSGASLGDIFKAAIKKREGAEDDSE